MTDATDRFRTLYGSHPLHLLAVVAGYTLVGLVLGTIGISALWSPQNWWQSIAVWFAAAIILHDLLLFPVYALIDRVLVGVSCPHRTKAIRRLRVPVLNYIRVPAMGAALTLLMFLPGIIEQGADTYLAATGQTQQPFLRRWLLLTAAMFAVSAMAYATRIAHGLRGRSTDDAESATNAKPVDQ